jgi:hypothetical protein
MASYKCPRCSGVSHYMGNVVVSVDGPKITGEIGNTGLYATGSLGKQTRTVQVPKCSNCQEVLSQSNYVPDESEKNLRDCIDNHWVAGIVGRDGAEYNEEYLTKLNIVAATFVFCGLFLLVMLIVLFSR